MLIAGKTAGSYRRPGRLEYPGGAVYTCEDAENIAGMYVWPVYSREDGRRI
jgi:hypothetical protein